MNRRSHHLGSRASSSQGRVVVLVASCEGWRRRGSSYPNQERLRRKRRRAISAQIASTTPKGHVPARNPYTLDSAQPQANARTNRGLRGSSAYMTSMNVRAVTPKAVSTRSVCPMTRGGLARTSSNRLVDAAVDKYRRGSNNFQGCGPGLPGRPL
jgi:hypothetical protein